MLKQADLAPFIGRWARIGTHDQYIEGTIIAVSETAAQLQPIVIASGGLPQISPHLGILALDTLHAVRVFEEAEARAEIEKVRREILAARLSQTEPPPEPKWLGGNYN